MDAATMIWTAREESGLTQAALAALAGMPQSTISAYEKGHREPSFAAVTRLLEAAGYTVQATRSSGGLRRVVHEKATELRTRFSELGAVDVMLFGSVARGDDRPESDIDLVVELTPEAGLFALMRMQEEAERILGRPVDVVPRDGLKPAVATSVEREAVAL